MPKGTPPGRYKVDSAKDFKGSIKKLINYLKPFYIYFIVSIILGFIASVFTIISPNRLRDLINIITEGIMTNIDMNKVRNLSIFIGSLYLLSSIFSYIQGFIMIKVTNKLSYKLRKEISTKINKLPLKYFDNNQIGDVLSRVTNDVDTIGQTLNNSVSSLVSSVTLFIGVLIMMFVTNFYMAITTIISSLIGFSIMAVILKNSQKYFDKLQKEIGNMNGHIEEVYSSLNVVKTYNAKEYESKRFDEINENLYECAKKSQFLSGMMGPIMGFIGNLGYVSVCVVGALLVINNMTTMGTIVAFIVYTRLFTSPLSNIAQSFNQLQSTAAASERVFEFLDEEEMSNQKEIKKLLDKNKVKGNISFEHVKFGYDDKIVINDFTANIKKGSKVAIVGKTGAGKTTMVNLLMKFYDIKEGDIKIDGVSIKELSRENIHDLFVMVLQDTWTYNGTVKENIVYNNKDISDQELVSACKVVGLDYFINTLEHGYDTVLTDESISSGQKQLITIARGILKNAPFLILDEATSNVDTRTEELVQSAMDELTKGKTSFIIAHRLSTIRNADLILVMQDGNIIEQGNHETLINKKGYYAELYNSQFMN